MGFWTQVTVLKIEKKEKNKKNLKKIMIHLGMLKMRTKAANIFKIIEQITSLPHYIITFIVTYTYIITYMNTIHFFLNSGIEKFFYSHEVVAS